MSVKRSPGKGPVADRSYDPNVPSRRLLTAVLAAALCIATVAPAVAIAGPPVRVAVIVGPVGEATQRYRERAEAAAREAERWTSDVVRVYSPNATWSAARRAMQGASIVIYLGHGNGWPSPYRSSLYPPTQDGLGLNPVAGVDDEAHQYFGEAYIARAVHLAPGAIVLLHHLCYASGTSEPGRLEGSLDVARQRVDNYAAGFLAAGAAAVVAETAMGPAAYVRELLSGQRSLLAAWRRAPTANGHEVAFPSERTPGFTTFLDPRGSAAGFGRSLVIRGDVPAGSVAAGAGQRPADRSDSDGRPSLAGLGLRVGTPALDGAPVAGASRVLSVTIDLPAGVGSLTGTVLGVRWTPLDPLPPVDVLPAASPAPPPVSQPSSGPSVPAPSSGFDETDPAGSTAEAETAAITQVQPEVPGQLVTVGETVADGPVLRATIVLPAVPGLYRLGTTLHDRDGVAYDEATQALVPALLVRVAGTLSAAYGLPRPVTVEVERTIVIPVRVANTGSVTWADEPPSDPAGPRDAVPVPWLVGRWVRLDSLDIEVPAPATAPAWVAPGAATIVRLPITTPSEPGTFLLLLDLDSPAAGSLAAAGSEPGLLVVRVIDTRSEPAVERR
jgi:hypothetical protein